MSRDPARRITRIRGRRTGCQCSKVLSRTKRQPNIPATTVEVSRSRGRQPAAPPAASRPVGSTVLQISAPSTAVRETGCRDAHRRRGLSSGSAEALPSPTACGAPVSAPTIQLADGPRGCARPRRARTARPPVDVSVTSTASDHRRGALRLRRRQHAALTCTPRCRPRSRVHGRHVERTAAGQARRDGAAGPRPRRVGHAVHVAAAQRGEPGVETVRRRRRRAPDVGRQQPAQPSQRRAGLGALRPSGSQAGRSRRGTPGPGRAPRRRCGRPTTAPRHGVRPRHAAERVGQRQPDGGRPAARPTERSTDPS